MRETASRKLERSAIYKLLSSAFLYPDEELFQVAGEFEEEASGSLRGGAGLDNVYEGLMALCRRIRERSVEDLRLEYQRVFGHTISREHPPYETQYGGLNVYLQTQELGDIAGFYRAFGLEISDRAGERLDHIGVQLEFMHFLSFKEEYAGRHHGEEKKEICREAQRKFVRDHMSRWVPLFCSLLKEKRGESIYAHLASVTLDFLSSEKDYLDIEPEEIEEFSPGDLEPEAEDFACGDAE